MAAAQMDHAASLRERAVHENNAGRPARALTYLRRALHLAGGSLDGAPDEDARLLVARILLTSAVSESELSGLDRGLSALSAVESYVESSADDSVAVLMYLQRGFMTVRGGRLRDGAADLDRAVELITHAGPAQQCNILINRGMAKLLLGDLSQARDDYRTAAQMARQNNLTVEEYKASHNLGEVEFYAGNLAEALRIMDEAAGLNADVSSAVVLLDRSKVLMEAGLHREADDALQEAEALFRVDRLWKDVGEVELARAQCALVSGEIASARRLAGRARTRFQRRGNDRWRRDAELTLLQADLDAGRPGGRLAGPALRLADEFDKAGLQTRRRTAQLIAAEALLKAGRLADAWTTASEAGHLRNDDPVAARLQTRLVRARLLAAAGEAADARRQVRDGLADLAVHQARFGGIDLQTASAVHGRHLVALDLSMALDQGAPGAVFSAIERGRATSSRLKPVEAPRDEVAAALLSELRQLVEQLRTSSSDPEEAVRLVPERERALHIQRTLRSRSWHHEGSGSSDRAVKFAAVMAAVREDDSTLVSLVESGAQIYAVVASGRGNQLVDLGLSDPLAELARKVRVDLDVLADDRVPGVIADAVRASLVRSVSRLDEKILLPLRLGSNRVVIVPSGRLALIPWGSLPSMRGRPVEVAPSATAWLKSRAQNARAQGRTVSALAGPGVERSGEEASSISRSWPGSAAVTGPDATQRALISALTSSSLVHIAAHGQHQAENPLFSSIRLADGPVFAYELDQSARAAEHVVLSACELGQATIRPGDEALGWTSVLLHLGTRCVIAGVAKVHDDVAANVMVRYHRALAGGTDSATALADACAAETDRPAPFVCFGSAITF